MAFNGRKKNEFNTGLSRSLPFEIEFLLDIYLSLNKNGFPVSWESYLWELPFATVAYAMPVICKNNMLQTKEGRGKANDIGERYETGDTIKDALSKLRQIREKGQK